MLILGPNRGSSLGEAPSTAPIARGAEEGRVPKLELPLARLLQRPRVLLLVVGRLDVAFCFFVIASFHYQAPQLMLGVGCWRNHGFDLMDEWHKLVSLDWDWLGRMSAAH
jgi:hypothetical protein